MTDSTTPVLYEVRCICGKLLLKAANGSTISIKCKGCHRIITRTVHHPLPPEQPHRHPPETK